MGQSWKRLNGVLEKPKYGTDSIFKKMMTMFRVEKYDILWGAKNVCTQKSACTPFKSVLIVR